MPVSDVCAGIHAAIGILLALNNRQHTGSGQYIDTNLFEAGISLGVYEAANVLQMAKCQKGWDKHTEEVRHIKCLKRRRLYNCRRSAREFLGFSM